LENEGAKYLVVDIGGKCRTFYIYIRNLTSKTR